MLRLHPTLIGILAVFAVTGCSGDTTGPADAPEPVPTTVQVSPSQVDLTVGGTQQFEARVLDQTGTPLPAPGSIIWSSSDASRVTVNEQGFASALRSGAAVITAAVGTLHGQATTTVLAPGFQPEPGSAVTARIGPTGGAIEAQSSAGVRYRLELPPGALLDSTTITVTPIASVTNAPFTKLLGAARFAPAGLVLLEPARLTIEVTDLSASARGRRSSFFRRRIRLRLRAGRGQG